jgi:hypothetical protein
MPTVPHASFGSRATKSCDLGTEQLVALTARYAMPTIYNREFTAAGAFAVSHVAGGTARMTLSPISI